MHFPLHPDTPAEGRSLEDLFAGRDYDPEASYLYGRYANAVIARREELDVLIEKQQALIAEAHGEVMAAFRELKKLEVVQERRAAQARKEALAVEQKSLDELGIDMHRRRSRG